MRIPSRKLKLILRLLADDVCVNMLLEIKKSDIYSDALAKKLKLPKSTIWKKLRELESAGVIESYITTASVGRRVRMYKFKDLILRFKMLSDILRCLEEEIQQL
ncbi:MAG: winged helix-turn-helix domain-containing protein [Nitrososphaeria archaeon]